MDRIIDLDTSYIEWLISKTNYQLTDEAQAKYNKACEEYSWEDDSNWEDDDFPVWEINQ